MTLMEMRGITKTFPGVIANDSVSFDLQPGEIHALVGENGAGKTTLMKILYGLYRTDAGSILINGKPVNISGPKDAIAKGIGMVHQHFMLVPVFSVLENIILGEENGVVLDLETPRKRITELMRKNGLELDLNAVVENLSVGMQQRVEIIKVLYRGASILVFDEPTAVLTPQEVKELFHTFEELKQQGAGVVFITHKLDEVLSVADRITVLRRGKVVRSMAREGVTKPQIAELMVGKPVLLKADNPLPQSSDTILEVSGLSYTNHAGTQMLKNISFCVQSGEIFGIAGVEGNGQSELVRAISEKTRLDSGRILLAGNDIGGLDVRSRREAGMAHIPEDRQRYGLIMPFSLADNLVLGRHHRAPFVTRGGMIRRAAIREFAVQSIRDYDVRTPSESVPALALSGGNQQKAIIAREMAWQPALLLACQPTRGVDIGATEFIYRRLVEAKMSGKAVLLVSADLDEIMALSDRIGVLYRGELIAVLDTRATTREAVGNYMLGASDHEAAKN